MNTKDLTKQFGKKTIPDVRPGDTVKIHYKITEGGKTRIQIFEGLVLSQKHGKGMDGTVKVRKISNGVGVERTFPLHSPLISKFEKIKSMKVRKSKLYFVRDIVGKKQKRSQGQEEYQMWEEALSEEEIAKIEEEKAKAAAEKKAQKAEKEKELKAKFDKAVASHGNAEK